MGRLLSTSEAEENLLTIGRYIAWQNQSIERAHQVLDRINEKCACTPTTRTPASAVRILDRGCVASQSRTSSLSTARSKMESSCSSSPTDTKTSWRFSASSSGTQ